MIHIQDLAKELEERSLTAMIGQCNNKWVVWLYPADDIALGVYIGTDEILSLAIKAAIDMWDVSEEEPS